MGKIDENKLQKKTRLMDTAYDLYTSQGIVKTTIEDIARKAGIAKGTFYLYFKDKYDLQDKLIAHRSEQVFEHALQHSDYEAMDNPEDKVLAIVDDILEQLRSEKLILKFIHKNLSWGVFRRALDKSETDFKEVFKEITGGADSAAADSAAGADSADSYLGIEIYLILELVGSTCYSVILDDDPVDFETFKPYLHRSIRALMRSFE